MILIMILFYILQITTSQLTTSTVVPSSNATSPLFGQNSSFQAFNITPTNITNFTSTNISAVVNIAGLAIENPFGAAPALIARYGYTSILVLTTLEGLSVPIPSEVILPVSGALSRKGYINFAVGFGMTLLGTGIGLIVDYYIGYFLGKRFFYEHMKLFRTSKEKFDNFENWFNQNSDFSVFITKLLPVVRTLTNYVAGFSRMPMKEYLAFSLSGIMIWNFALMTLGYYFVTTGNATVIITILAILAIALYFGHRMVSRNILQGKPKPKV